MSDPMWFVYAPVALMATVLWVRRASRCQPKRWSWVLLLGSIIFAIHFFLPFHILGLYELISGRAAVSASSATIVSLAVFCSGWLVWGRHPAPLEADGGMAASMAAVNCAMASNRTWARSPDRISRSVLTLTLITLGAAGAMIAYGGFPGGRDTESIAYHLPIGVNIFQTGSLQVYDRAYMHSFPANASIWYGYWLALGWERFTAVANFVLLVPLGAAIYEIGHVLNVSRPARDMSLAGLLTIPIVAFNTFSSESNVGGIAWLACALALALSNTTGSEKKTALTGVCLGLAYGFKSFHLIGAALISMWLLFSDLRRISVQLPAGADRQPRFSAIFKTQALLVGCFLITGGYWLARNWVEFGNPFYPVQLPVVSSIAGWSAAPDFSLAARSMTQFEWVRSSAEWLLYPWLEWHDPLIVTSGGGASFGPFVGSILLVAVLAALVTSRLRTDPDASKRAFLIVGGGFILLVWWVLGDRQPRYLMGAFVFWIPLVGWFLSSLPSRWALLQFWLATVSVVTMIGALLATQAIHFGDHFVFAKQDSRWEYYEYPPELDALPSDSVLINLAHRNWGYPLFGARLSYRVINNTSEIVAAALSPSNDNATSLSFYFAAGVLERAGVTHVFAVDTTAIGLDGCATLKEVGRFDRQPSSGNPVRPARVLYAVVYPLEPCSSGNDTR